MAGLVPAIHDFAYPTKNVDARHKAGHDEVRVFGGLLGPKASGAAGLEGPAA